MCNKVKLYEKEGISFLLSLPIKHKNRIKIELLKQLKITALIEAGKEIKPYEKYSF